jgi:hypothetical protein
MLGFIIKNNYLHPGTLAFKFVTHQKIVCE